MSKSQGKPAYLEHQTFEPPRGKTNNVVLEQV